MDTQLIFFIDIEYPLFYNLCVIIIWKVKFMLMDNIDNIPYYITKIR